MSNTCPTVILSENIVRLKKLRRDYQDLLQRDSCLNYPRYSVKRKEIQSELTKAKTLEMENYQLLQKIKKTL